MSVRGLSLELSPLPFLSSLQSFLEATVDNPWLAPQPLADGAEPPSLLDCGGKAILQASQQL